MLREENGDLRNGREPSRRGQGLKKRDRNSEGGGISGRGLGTWRGDWGLETGLRPREECGSSDRGWRLQKAWG